jgi:PPOX class probable F420-dependent enzyme
MPGYGIATTGEGLLPWSWAQERLAASRNYWVVTLWPDGGPHSMPVWGAWDGEALWFTSGRRSRKARNVAGDPRCVVTTEDASDPVVVEGAARIVTGLEEIERVRALLSAKYDDSYPEGFLDPAVNATIRVAPQRAFALRHDDFTGSPTRWVFDRD